MSTLGNIDKMMDMLKSESIRDAQIRAILDVLPWAKTPVIDEDFPGQPYSRSEYVDETWGEPNGDNT